ncbi:MAG: serine hydrolase [Bdellovibrionaceae bacterium]|nr:serine hydrolase [Pseudobdellovibrionaceae bacterium]
MTTTHFVRAGLACLLLSAPLSSFALMPTNPVSDREFTRLPSGKDLREISVNGSRLSLSKGTGSSFTAKNQAAYLQLKEASKNTPGHPVQWAFMDLDAGRVLEESLESNRKIFGASTSKIFVGATLLDKQEGSLNSSQLQLMANMIVVSSNTAWTNLQSQIGNGNANTGRSLVHQFTQGMGYDRMRGFQGYWGNLHGNELTAAETVRFLHDTYKGLYPGAETLWKLMHTCRTGGSRGRKYIPTSIYVGGKTGTFDGSTIDPETGSSKHPNGKPYTVRIRNHAMVFHVNGRQYGLVVLADSGSDESAALLAGGLLREYGQIP